MSSGSKAGMPSGRDASVGGVGVATATQIALIAKKLVKTDPRDALTLARLLAAGILPTVWVPPAEVRELRALGGHRSRLIKQRTQVRNRLRSVLFAHNLIPPPGEAFGPVNRGWWQGLDLPASEKLRVRQDLSILDSLEPLIKEVEGGAGPPKQYRAVGQSRQRSWYTCQVLGCTTPCCCWRRSATSELRRPHKLVGYAGLGASVHSSGEQDYGGRITKQGRRDIRSTMVEAAWVAVGGHPYWKELFDRLAVRVGKPNAIIAIARKMLLVVWHVLTNHVADREAVAEKVAGKFMEWSWKLGNTRAGLTSGTFIRPELRRLQLGDNIPSITRGNRRFPIPVEEAEQVG